MNSEDWPTVRLGDFVEVTHGFAFKTKYANGEPSPYALFTRKNVALGGGFREEGRRYYHGDFDERFVLEPGDLMLVLTDLSKHGDLLGLPAFVPRSGETRYLHNQRVGKVVFRKEGVDRRFLYAMFRSPDYRRHVLDTASQTTVRDTAPSRLYEYSFRLPPLSEQKRIAEVVGAFDDKIESNRRLAILQEETVARLFRARFVDFIGIDEWEDSAIGPIPHGWEIGRLADLVVQRKEHCRPSETTAALPYVPIDMIRPRSLMLAEHKPGEAAKSSLVRFETGDILFGAMRPYFHKVALAPFCGITRTTVFVLQPTRSEDWAYIALLLSQTTTIEFATRTSRGSTIPYAVWDGVLSEMPVVIAPPAERAAFDRLARPLLTSIQNLGFEQRALADVRDLLLPKLVSGEIRVSEADDVATVVGPPASEMTTVA